MNRIDIPSGICYKQSITSACYVHGAIDNDSVAAFFPFLSLSFLDIWILSKLMKKEIKTSFKVDRSHSKSNFYGRFLVN